MSAKKEDPAVTNFREYLRIKSVHPNPDYEGCVAFLRRMAGELDLPFRTVEMVKDKPIILMTWEGTDPSLPTVLLNSHIDVVPVYPEHWKYDPFAAVKEENGDIYARGTQDMKCVGIQYLEAIRRFKAEGKRFLRTFHLSFVPDEEIGGFDGMKLFIHSDDFKNLNIAFALDEGLANPTDAFTVYYGERSPWWVWVTCSGNPGHGSRFIENTAAEKIQSVINSFLEFRAEEKKKLEADSKLTLGDVTTCNMTMLEGGVQFNVVPTEMSVGFDIRITPTVDMIQLEKRIQSWCDKAGEGVTVSYKQKCDDQSVTPINDANVWWKAFSTACKDRNAILEPEIFPAATDSRYLREIGLPALGFSPMNNTPILLHDHNEFLNENVFLKGIDIYCDILTAVGSVPAQ